MRESYLPTIQSVLNALTKERLFDLGRVLGAGLKPARREKQAALANALATILGRDRLPEVLRELGRDELRAVCRSHDIRINGDKRAELINRLAEAAGFDGAASVHPAALDHEEVPTVGQVLTARGRQWLVEGVENGKAGESPLLKLACLDDDAPGKPLALLWDLELGARVVTPETEGLGNPTALDSPAHFGAYLHAIKWSTVSAADANLFQAPFRAGIKLMPHQLTPLMKALELPRANLFIADDVGLGKTIEAGLVLQELILRQQAEFVLIVCPASVSLQWRDEMMRRFGLRFEVMSRQFVANRRRERGFGVNPWATHNRFIISHPLIRRPDYRDPLLAHLGYRAEKGLLIVDEAHVAAPASAGKYAVDSDTTRTIRDLAPKFDNRLFLSATPHNGHSNSFSALLEILDPIRFTRGVPVEGADALAPIMVRRLKRDLRQLGMEQFPRRILVRVALTHKKEGWSASLERYDAEEGATEAPTPLASKLGGVDTELELSTLLARYTTICSPKKGRGRLVFINLQKRLLSSPEAFARTLEKHALSVEKKGGVTVRSTAPENVLYADTETHGMDDDTVADEEDADMYTASQKLPPLTKEAVAILKKMRALAEKSRRQPDGKTRALLAWLRAHACPAVGAGPSSDASPKWSDRRVIIFTEYAHTKRYLQELLTEAAAYTDRGDERIRVFHGGMGDDARDEIQQAFNAEPSKNPVRILIATDAAREGVNLQAHCADLFHFDVPWNPSRLEQRNGRIDRTLQPADEVRCHYFVYPDRKEDRVLDTLVRKINTVKQELGSAGEVLLGEMERTLEPGITETTASAMAKIGTGHHTQTAEKELESQRTDLKKMDDEVHRAGRLLDQSKRALAVSPASLRGVVDMGLRMSSTDGLIKGPVNGTSRQSWILPELDVTWQPTLDCLRPPRGREESFWEWRRRPPKSVTFEPLETLTQEAEQLHLAHPVVKRILDRFLAQGYGAHDLSRICGVVVPNETVARVIAYARLSLFGKGAARLHDELIAVAAPWPTKPDAVLPYKDAATAAKAKEITEAALAKRGIRLPKKIAARLAADAPALFRSLWPHLNEEAEERAVSARNGLTRRGRKESDDLVRLIERQQKAIRNAIAKRSQLTLDDVKDKMQKRQIALDLEHLKTREQRIATELKEEPAAVEALYEVKMTRLSPVGLVIAWPEAMV